MATSVASERAYLHATGLDFDNIVFAGVWTHGVGYGGPDGTAMQLQPELSAENDAAARAQLTTLDEPAIVRRTISVPLPAGVGADGTMNALAYEGDVDWSTILLDGRPPQSGEVVVSADLAGEIGAKIGDELTLMGHTKLVGEGPQPDSTVRLTIVGLSRIAELDGFSAGPLIIVAWDDIPALADAFGLLSLRNADGAVTSPMDTMYQWEGVQVPAALAGLESLPAYEPSTGAHVGDVAVVVSLIMAALVLVIAVAVALVTRNLRSDPHADSIGRSARGVLARAALAGVVAATLGLGIGWGIDEAVVVASASAHPEVISTEHAALSWLVALAVLVLGAVTGAGLAAPLIERGQRSDDFSGTDAFSRSS